MTPYVIRRARRDDIDFLTDVIIGAEKSNTDKLGLATLFGLTEERVRPLLAAMLDEDVDGCEFSVSSFLVATQGDEPVGAAAGWIEGSLEGGLASQFLKANLIGYVFPPESLEHLRSVAPIVSTIQIEREPGTLQIEYVHVRSDHRGHGLARSIVSGHIEHARQAAIPVRKAALQVFSNNLGAVNAYTRSGFHTVREVVSSHPDIGRYLPYRAKLLMENQLA